jgi:tetratricopeptide (TPR) repeat protein
MKSLRNLLYIIFCLTFLVFTGCQKSSEKKGSVTLGTIEFDVTSTTEAVGHFETGVLLLHSFMYADAADAFQKAQVADKDFAMAYWGEAMTYNHPLWSEQNYEKGKEVLLRLGATKGERLEKAPTKFEKDLFEGVEILFGDGTKFERDDAYAEHMGNLHEKYPKNHEIAAFYALSLLGSVEQGRDYDVYGKGAKIAQGILNENPEHPGALHYLIHSFDDPEHAKLALNAANNYSKVAPDAGHALHMPSHIYIALGMWDDVISSNVRSYEAKLKKVNQNNKLNWNLHAYHWLLYGYLQKNELEKARQIMVRMEPYISTNNSIYTKYYAIEMLGIYSAETGNWEGPFSSIRVDSKKLNVQSKVSQLFIDGYSAFQKGDQETLENSITKMKDEITTASNQLVTRGITVCSGVSFAGRTPNQDDIDLSSVLVIELEASLAILNEEKDEVIEKILIEATNLESSISFNFGPPSIVIPTYEMYGNWLLEQGRYQEALEQFDKSLEKGPGRRKALLGKLEAAKGLKDSQMIGEIENLLDIQMVTS